MRAPIHTVQERIFARITGLKFGTGTRALMTSVRTVPCRVIKRSSRMGCHRDVCHTETIMERELHLTVKLSLHPRGGPIRLATNIRTDGVSRGCCRPPLVRIVPSKYRDYRRGGCRIDGMYGKYLTRPYRRIYPENTVSVIGKGSFVSRSGYVGYKGYGSIYPCSTVTGGRHPYGGTYKIGTVASSGLKHTCVSTSGYISYKVYVMDYPFNTVSSGSRVFRLTHTLSRKRRIMTRMTPTFINRFKPGVGIEGFGTTLRRLKFSRACRITLKTSVKTVTRTRRCIGGIAAKRLPFLLASYYPS